LAIKGLAGKKKAMAIAQTSCQATGKMDNGQKIQQDGSNAIFKVGGCCHRFAIRKSTASRQGWL
jgi:hypothetical protein